MKQKNSHGNGFNFKKIRSVEKVKEKNNKLVRGTFYGKKWYPYNP